MLVLGIDTSCDDTSASLLRLEGARVDVLTNVVSSQEEIHTKYGGIVPELASRRHNEMIWPVVKEALGETELKELDAVAVCQGPGLIGALLVGCSFGKALCYASGVPLVAVNHLEGHLLSPFLGGESSETSEHPGVPEFPYLSLVVSGGHTSLYLAEGYGKYRELGRTRDDAAGEAYDKVAKLLGLGYPGGPVIDRLAREGDAEAVKLPRAYLPETLDFSFSGLKTAVRLLVEREPDLRVEDVCAGFQASVVDVLVRKMEWAMKTHRVKRIAIAGGVASNRALRERMAWMAEGREARVWLPENAYCTDNAAMIALAGAHAYRRGETAGLDLNPRAVLPIGQDGVPESGKAG